LIPFPFFEMTPSFRCSNEHPTCAIFWIHFLQQWC
jgi:hypothetical protein